MGDRLKWGFIAPPAAFAAVMAVTAIAAAATEPDVAPSAPPVVTATVTVEVTGVRDVAGQVVTVGGQELPLTPSDPVTVAGGPAQISVIGWATAPDARCAVHVDGLLVAEDTETVVGRPASCIWG